MTTTPAMPELPNAIKAYRDKGTFTMPEAFYTADQMRAYALATLQAQPAAEVSGEPEQASKVVNDSCWKFVEAMPHKIPGPIWNDLKPAIYAALIHYHRAILALRPQSESEQEKELRRSLAEAQATISERNAEIIELQKRIRRSPQAVPMTDEQKAAPKLIGWRTENFLWETDDVDKARNWEPNIGVLPIFEGDPNTKLGSHGITAPAGGEG